MKLEHIDLGDGIILDANFREAALLAELASDAQPLVHNGMHRSYLLSPITLDGRTFRPSLYFTDGLLASVHLTWVDPETKGASAWDGFSFDRERSIAKEDAAWLSSYLGKVASADSTFCFNWGNVWSGFDERSGFSSIVVRYRRA